MNARVMPNSSASFSREQFLTCSAGLLMLAFQIRYVNDGAVVKALSIALSGFLTFASVLLLRGAKQTKRVPYVLLVYFFVLFSSFFVEYFAAKDSQIVKAVGGSLFVVFAFVLATNVFSFSRYSSPGFFVKILYFNLAAYVLVNFLLFAVGLRRDWSDQFVVDYESGSAVMLGWVGITADRVNFILSNGINSYGPVLGLLLGLSFLQIRKGVFYILMLGVAGVSCLLIDSRSSIFYPALAILFAYFVGKRGRWKFAAILTALLPFFPFVSEFVFLLAGLFLGDASFLSRNDTDAGSLNGRLVIWVAIVRLFADFDLMQIFGYGNAGQVVSGATVAVGATDEFANYANPEALSAHNTYLQVLLNYGYFGLALHVLLIYMCLFKIRDMSNCGILGQKNRILLLFVYFEIVLFNNTEVGLIPTGQLFIPFVLLVSFLVMARSQRVASISYQRV